MLDIQGYACYSFFDTDGISGEIDQGSASRIPNLPQLRFLISSPSASLLRYAILSGVVYFFRMWPGGLDGHILEYLFELGEDEEDQLLDLIE